MHHIKMIKRQMFGCAKVPSLRKRDRQAFSSLEQAMRRHCARLESRDHLDQWLADGY